MFFNKELAEASKVNVGEKYRPVNGSEDYMFRELYCCCCANLDDCTIEMYAKHVKIDDPLYPSEWQIGKDGQPTCTAFLELGEED